MSDLTRAEDAVLRMLRDSGPQDSAPDMIANLERLGHSEYAIRTAIWRLLDRNEIELTFDRRLQVWSGNDE